MNIKSILILLLLFILECNCKFAIFVLGDSVSYRLYRFGLAPTFNCSIEDPFIIRQVEKVEYNGYYGDYTSNKAWKCSGIVSRIGFAFNWGVSDNDGDYAIAYRSHRSPNDTINSVNNIINAIEEFKLRSGKDESEVFFLFSSNLWDIHRYQQNYHSHPDIDTWLQQWIKNYSSVVLNIFDRMRPIDKLVLQTTHHIKAYDELREPSILLNKQILKVAAFFQLLVFDTRNFVEDNNLHLEDNRHQKQDISMLYAKQIGLKNWTQVQGVSVGSLKCFSPGTLLKQHGSGIYWLVKEDLKRHWIPNWDTLLSLNLNPNNVEVLNDKDFSDIDEGDPIEPCKNC